MLQVTITLKKEKMPFQYSPSIAEATHLIRSLSLGIVSLQPNQTFTGQNGEEYSWRLTDTMRWPCVPLLLNVTLSHSIHTTLKDMGLVVGRQAVQNVSDIVGSSIAEAVGMIDYQT